MTRVKSRGKQRGVRGSIEPGGELAEGPEEIRIVLILLFVGMAAGVIVLGIKYGVEKRKNHSGDPGGAQQ